MAALQTQTLPADAPQIQKYGRPRLLTRELIEKIKTAASSGEQTQTEAALEFGIPKSSFCKLRQRLKIPWVKPIPKPRQPAPPKAEVLIARIIFDTKAWMYEAARLRGCASVKDWHSNILRAELAGLRLWKLSRVPPKGEKDIARGKNPNDFHRTVLSAEAVQRLLHLAGEMSIPELARRFGVSLSAVRAILRRFENGKHVSIPSRAGVRGPALRVNLSREGRNE